ncbi:hypothetical protein HanIR_Chr03g0149571 [Helianthus annuus]|nr:hypothetical protein HanIR_Chr03g0149571 [Helianthus annuus]
MAWTTREVALRARKSNTSWATITSRVRTIAIPTRAGEIGIMRVRILSLWLLHLRIWHAVYIRLKRR